MNSKQNTVTNQKSKVLNIPFQDFWNLYEKKQDREKCEKKWSALSNKDREACINVLPDYVKATPDKVFRKNPITYLNNKSWENEIITQSPVNKYSEQLKNPKWQKRKSEIMTRDFFTCQLCSDTETELHVHHKRYLAGKSPWEYDDKDLITLCINCHKKISQ